MTKNLKLIIYNKCLDVKFVISAKVKIMDLTGDIFETVGDALRIRYRNISDLVYAELLSYGA